MGVGFDWSGLLLGRELHIGTLPGWVSQACYPCAGKLLRGLLVPKSRPGHKIVFLNHKPSPSGKKRRSLPRSMGMDLSPRIRKRFDAPHDPQGELEGFEAS